MSKTASVETEDGRRSVWPLFITVAVAVLGICSMLIVDLDRGMSGLLQIRKTAHYATTEDAARAAGAMVTPITPKPALEPVPAGPKPVQPAIPDQKKS